MSDLAIRADRLGKRYERYEPQSGLLQRIGLTRKPMGGCGSGTLGDPEGVPRTFWALRDASFEIEHGEVVAVIGRNGCGKSTLLKLLSRITEPTTGRADIYGRVGSLLEVGTGFHPDLTGWENVYLNGSLLGMRKAEISRKFDEIVAFSGVEAFLGMPVKHYSSGMYVRLAFSIAAHLEPEILIIDEVLAVGDGDFQKKCLAKVYEVAQGGRAVLLVSHNMMAVKQLCTRAFVLQAGQIELDTDPEAGILSYNLQLSKANLVTKVAYPPDRQSAVSALLFEVLDGAGNAVSGPVDTALGLRIRMTYELNKPVSDVHAYLQLSLENGQTIFSTGDADQCRERFGSRKPGVYCAEVAVPPRLLGAGVYRIHWFFGVPYGTLLKDCRDVLTFQVVDEIGRIDSWNARPRAGVLGLAFPWNYLEEP